MLLFAWSCLQLSDLQQHLNSHTYGHSPGNTKSVLLLKTEYLLADILTSCCRLLTAAAGPWMFSLSLLEQDDHIGLCECASPV